MNPIKKVIVALAAISLVACSTESQDLFSADKFLKIGVDKVSKTCDNLTQTDRYPRYIDHGQTSWTLVSVDDWTSGFYPGVLWLAYEYSGDEHLRARAEAFTAPIANIGKRDPRDHDIGFIVSPSFGNGYRLTGNPQYKEVMLAAADTLATLFRTKVGAIHSWPFKAEYEHNTIVDNMMNLELLFWAAKNGGDKERLENIAIRHAETTQKYLVRPDSAVYHLGSFTYEGEFLRGVAHQGYADESMWARGQAWGIYGFAIAYREVGRKDFLETSMKLADHFMDRLPTDGVPYWDFDAPNIPNEAKDASASAAASGMLELYQLIKDRYLAEKYYNNAVKLLSAISTPEYVSGERNDAILTHSTGHHPKGWEIDVPIVYGDYYYLDALLKLKKINESR